MTVEDVEGRLLRLSLLPSGCCRSLRDVSANGGMVLQTGGNFEMFAAAGTGEWFARVMLSHVLPQLFREVKFLVANVTSSQSRRFVHLRVTLQFLQRMELFPAELEISGIG